MINKFFSIAKPRQNKPQKQVYASPYEVPQEQHCENCAYQGTATCNGINCFTGIMKKIEMRSK